MSQGKSLIELLELARKDLRETGGQRIRDGLSWQARRLRKRTRAAMRTNPLLRSIDDNMLSGGFDLESDRRYSIEDGVNAALVTEELQERLSEAGILYMLGGCGAHSGRAMHIHVDDLTRLVDILVDLRRFKMSARRRNFHIPVSRKNVRAIARARGSLDLLIEEQRLTFQAESLELGGAEDKADHDDERTVVHAERRHIQCSRIQVLVWKPAVGAYGLRHFEIDGKLPMVRRLREPTFYSLMKSHHDFDHDLSGLDEPQFDIDVVYTWVDGDDPEWLEQRNKYANELGESESTQRVTHDERFRNRDELKYSLRSLELFAPWIRKIHIVTMGQCPPWLDTNHPKINMVDHRDIYSDDSWLPTFNSSSIETQLHHVDGLAKHFIYFNDDVFLGEYCFPKDFFAPNGAIKCFPSPQRAFEVDIDADSEEYLQADKNAIKLIAKRYPFVGRELMQHVPHPSNCDLLYEIEREFPKEFARAAAARFRSAADLRPIAFMQFHYGYHQGLVEFSRISHCYLSLWRPNILAQLADTERRRAAKTMCVNDVGLQPSRLETVNRAVVGFLEAYFPSPSSYELPPE